MKRFCDAALMASFLAMGPALAGTPIANSGDMATPVSNLAPISVTEVTPPPGAGGATVPANSGAAESGCLAGGLFEALIADFRWGEPEMGAVPHLPVPPPHKMRAEDLEEGGQAAPVDGNSGNPLPLYIPQVPQVLSPAPAARDKPPTIGPGDPAPVPGPNTIPGHDTAAPAHTATERATHEQIMRQLASVSANASRTETGSVHASTAAQVTAAAQLIAAAGVGSRASRADAVGLPPVAASAPTVPSPTVAAFVPPAVGTNAPAPTRDRVQPAQPRIAAAVANSGRTPEVADTNVASRTFADTLPESSTSGVMRDVVFQIAETSQSAERFLSFETFQSSETTDAAQPFILTANTATAAPTTSSPSPLRTEGPVLALHTPVTQPEWAEGIGERVIWLTEHNVNNAQLRLNPAHLGPVEVRVSVTEDHTSVSFVAHHAATREALESAAPRLREMLASQGFGSVNVDISQHSAGHRTAQDHQRQPGWIATQAEDAHDARGYAPARIAPRERAGLDTFA